MQCLTLSLRLYAVRGEREQRGKHLNVLEHTTTQLSNMERENVTDRYRGR